MRSWPKPTRPPCWIRPTPPFRPIGRSNLELNLCHYEDRVVEKVEGWFDELWQAAVPYDLAELYDRLMAEDEPYLIYLRVLWELYGGELVEELTETPQELYRRLACAARAFGMQKPMIRMTKPTAATNATTYSAW